MLDAALEQHRLRHAERLLLEQTVRGSIEVLADVLSLASPKAFGRATRIRGFVKHIVSTLKLADAWQYETAALLSQIGCVAIPDDLLDRLAAGESLPSGQREMVDEHPAVAEQLLSKIPRLQTVAAIVGSQAGSRTEAKAKDPNVIVGGRILAAALDLEELLSLGAKKADALASLKTSPRKYGARVLQALDTIDAAGFDGSSCVLALGKLRVGMVLDEDVRKTDGTLVLSRGHELSEGSLLRLRNYSDLGLLAKRECQVVVEPDPDSAGSAAA